MITRNVSTVLIGCLLVLGLAQAHAAILVELSGTPASSTITYSFSGSGTWQGTATRNAGLHFNSNNSQSNFVDANFAANVDVALTGMLTNTTTGLGIAITGLRFTDSINGDDWSLLLAAGTISGTLGDSYTLTGSGTFSLGSLTFSNLIPGSNVSNVGTGTTDFGPATLTVVPEPATLPLMAGVSTLLLAVARRRRRE